jgi:hypothetical protein
MTSAEFLSHIWPSSGHYVIATPFTIPGTKNTTYAQKVFDSIEEAADYVAKIAKTKDVFYGVHSLKQPKVWNPEKTNPRTGELGKYEVRVQSNMLAAKAFFFDLDVKPDDRHYGSREEAVLSLRAFCKSTGLPKPMVTSSGGGLHVYWVLTDEISTSDWLVEAAKLKAIASHFELKFDPARTTDTASVLRVAGTFNHKTDTPRPVQVLSRPTPLEPAEFSALLDKIVDDNEVSLTTTTRLRPPVDLGKEFDLGNNLVNEFTGPPVTMRAMITACAQVRRLAILKGNVAEPEWYHSLNLVRFTENGRAAAHKISSGHPGYDYEKTEDKLHQLESQSLGPTTCAKLAEVSEGGDLCAGCAFKDKVKSPIVAARYRDKAAAPSVEVEVGDEKIERKIPDAPAPYLRLRQGGIVRISRDEEGAETHEPVLEVDLYPVSRIINVTEEREQQVWCAVLPRVGATEFTLDGSALYDMRTLTGVLANAGVYPHPASIKRLQDYMVAYIKELQKLADAEAQCDHLGWTADFQQFILPDGILQANGARKPVTLSKNARGTGDTVGRAGGAAQQERLLKFYGHDGYVVNQFFVAASLAAPLFYATGQHGVVVNASGDAGASKSTTLYTAAALWGNPEQFTLNGTNQGATALARQQRMTTLANLPLCVDEITHMNPTHAADMVMGITQPTQRIWLSKERQERKGTSNGYKSTIMLSTANSSLHGLLSTDNTAGTAGSMRVFEIAFPQTTIHKKYEADEYLRELKQNYGHVGPAFIEHVIKNRAVVEARVHDKMKYVDERAAIKNGERFWSATAAAALVATEVANELGLLAFNTAVIEKWFFETQIPLMRGVVRDEYANPVAVLTDFIERYNSRVAVTENMQQSGKPVPYLSREPRGDMLAHYHRPDGVMHINRAAFKTYCAQIGANVIRVLDELHRPSLDARGQEQRVVANPRIKKVLGKGTILAKVQSWCITVNMRHPDIAGATELEVVTGRTSESSVAHS